MGGPSEEPAVEVTLEGLAGEESGAVEPGLFGLGLVSLAGEFNVVDS